jgi:tetratricopeptide (TPR) repeat protein
MLRTWLTVLAVLAGVGFSFAGDPRGRLDEDKRWEQARKSLAQGRAAQAKAEFEALAKEYPTDADLQLFLAMSHMRLHDPQGAILASQRAIALDPRHVEARTFLGSIELEVRGDVDAAIRQYRAVVELRPDAPEAYANLAAAQKRKGDLREAIVSLNKALELKPKFGTALNNRGWIYTEQEKWTEARADFEAALKIDPQDQGALQGLARVLEKERDYAGAQRILQQLNARTPNFVVWLDWGRLGLIRFWWVLLSIAVAVALWGRFKKMRTANG